MASITPVLDTLLHEVLGRRMDAPTTRLTPPVSPLYPSKATQAVQGDARLQSQGGATGLEDARSSPGKRTSFSAADNARPGASSYTRLSPAANLISAVLARFPAPPSIIRPAASLFPSSAPLLMQSGFGENSPSASAQLQERLTSTIRDSGLFYESHLKAWFRGAAPLQRLLLQPQMAGFVGDASTPAAQPGAGAAARNLGAPAARDAPDSRPEPMRAAALHIDEAENLQTLLRHQLELLVAPVLRWEGEIWPGLFMSLVLDLARHDTEEARPDEHADSETASECQAELELVLEGLGSVEARLELRDAHLKLLMRTASVELYALMQKGRELLMDRLNTDDLVAELHLVLEEVSDDEEI